MKIRREETNRCFSILPLCYPLMHTLGKFHALCIASSAFAIETKMKIKNKRFVYTETFIDWDPQALVDIKGSGDITEKHIRFKH